MPLNNESQPPEMDGLAFFASESSFRMGAGEERTENEWIFLMVLTFVMVKHGALNLGNIPLSPEIM
ncbi:hypothetical protein D1970_06455 [Mesobacillus zeae]|uniref:Uncharacterized protein n=1 Tax=Mesobacillus zeae TaxID=1917180 RepID=A0A398BBD4_9BACI|nr:hypothetical protein D1970_06455 [Mesobacillus zeae]